MGKNRQDSSLLQKLVNNCGWRMHCTRRIFWGPCHRMCAVFPESRVPSQNWSFDSTCTYHSTKGCGSELKSLTKSHSPPTRSQRMGRVPSPSRIWLPGRGIAKHKLGNHPQHLCSTNRHTLPVLLSSIRIFPSIFGESTPSLIWCPWRYRSVTVSPSQWGTLIPSSPPPR